MDIKHEIFIKEEPSSGGMVIKEEPTGGMEYNGTDDQMFEQSSRSDEIKEDESYDSDDDIKTKIEIKEESFGIGLQNDKNPESLKQISGVNESKDPIKECSNKNSDAFKSSRHERLRRENSGTENLDRGELSCSYCYFIFESEEELMSHLESCERKVKCSRCGSDCDCESNLKFQMLKQGNTDRNILKRKLLKCSECNYECNRKGILKEHLLKHENTKLFKCSECNYECNFKCSLKQHMLKHQNVKLFKCSECDYECNQKKDLNRHVLKHQNLNKPIQNKI